jgi:hypothetical protein
MATTGAEIEEPRRPPTIRRWHTCRHTPDVETADPEFKENLQTVIAKTER